VKLVIDTGLWAPLLALFIARGLAFLYQTFGARLLAWLHRREPARPSHRPAPPADQAGSALGRFYGRVVIMHLAILFGAFLSMFGSIAPLIILILAKTAVDLTMHIAFDLNDTGKATKALFGAT
jgi:hypothetical protein